MLLLAFAIRDFLVYKSPRPVALEHQTVISFLSGYNMKFLIVFVALFALAVARPNDVQTLKELRPGDQRWHQHRPAGSP